MLGLLKKEEELEEEEEEEEERRMPNRDFFFRAVRCLKCVIVYLARVIPAFVMYCINGASRSSLLIASRLYDNRSSLGNTCNSSVSRRIISNRVFGGRGEKVGISLPCPTEIF